MDNPVEEIKGKLDIVDFIGSYITLKKTGRNFRAVCPFHQEKTPSFIISPERQIWHCFGACGEGGDVIKFLMKWENITFFEALKELAQKTGVKLTSFDVEDKAWKKKERFYKMNFLATEFFNYILEKSEIGKNAREYLKERAIRESTIRKFKLGYAPSSWDSLRLFLKKKEFSEAEVEENGLLVKSSSGKYYDRFRGRLIFPIIDSRGNILGFSGRLLDKNAKEAKYVNTPETPVYHKRETLYGINASLDEIKKEKNAYIVEGEFDMITPYQNGLTNFVAIKGTAVTAEQLILLKRYTDKITLMLDADPAGLEAIKRGIDEADKLGFDMRVVRLEGAKDPDEAVRTDLGGFKQAIAKPTSIYDFLIDSAAEKYPLSDAFGKKKIADEVVPYIGSINNPVVKSHYIKKLSDILEVEEESIESLIFRLKREKRKKPPYKQEAPVKKNDDREVVLQKYILSYIFQAKDPVKESALIFSLIAPVDFSIPSYQKIAEIFTSFYKGNDKKFSIGEFVNQLNPQLKSIFDEIYLFSVGEERLEDENINKLCLELKRFALKTSIKKLLGSQEGEQNKKNLLEFSNELKEVEKKLLPL